MRYCHNCGRITTGEPLYCQFCGRTYNVKLCPRLHPNSRSASVCSQCGSRELSTPAPRVPLYLKPFVLVLSILPGAILLLATVVFLAVFIRHLLADPNSLLGLMLVGLVLALCWYVWMHLPAFFRKFISKAFRKGGKHDKSKH
jgi:RNA polymerase subunit RPABC4/transcription elongation factor Spt4